MCNRFNKNLMLLKDVILPHHPVFSKVPSIVQDAALQDPEFYNCERGVEVSMAAASNGMYTFVDAAGYDNSDYSDTKTASVNLKTGLVEIIGTETKIGALRIVIYNAIANKLDYMFIPNQSLRVTEEPYYGKGSSHRLRMKYNEYLDRYNRFDHFRVASFKDLALKK